LKAPQNNIPAMPPATTNVPSANRALGREMKAQVRAISPFRAVSWPGSLMISPVADPFGPAS
jgi:hypothetical protein